MRVQYVLRPSSSITKLMAIIGLSAIPPSLALVPGQQGKDVADHTCHGHASDAGFTWGLLAEHDHIQDCTVRGDNPSYKVEYMRGHVHKHGTSVAILLGYGHSAYADEPARLKLCSTSHKRRAIELHGCARSSRVLTAGDKVPFSAKTPYSTLRRYTSINRWKKVHEHFVIRNGVNLQLRCRFDTRDADKVG